MLTTALKRAASPHHSGNLGRAGKLGLIALALSFSSAPLSPVSAQAIKKAPAQPGPAASAARSAPATSSAPAATVLAQMGRAAGVTIVADSAVGALRVQAPREATTLANLEQQIAGITRQLPPGTDWAKLMLPAPAPKHPWKGDDVAMFAAAAFRLYGADVFSSSSLHSPVTATAAAPPIATAPASPAAAAAAPGADSADMNLLAQNIPGAKVSQYTADLHLQPVYVVANSSVRSASNSPLRPLDGPNGMGAGAGLGLSADQVKSALADGNYTPVDLQSQEFGEILSMLPQAQREQILHNMQSDPDSIHVLSVGHGVTAITQIAPAGSLDAGGSTDPTSK